MGLGSSSSSTIRKLKTSPMASVCLSSSASIALVMPEGETFVDAGGDSIGARAARPRVLFVCGAVVACDRTDGLPCSAFVSAVRSALSGSEAGLASKHKVLNTRHITTAPNRKVLRPQFLGLNTVLNWCMHGVFIGMFAGSRKSAAQPCFACILDPPHWKPAASIGNSS